MSYYRNIAFFLKGRREFTRSGFERASRNFDTSEGTAAGDTSTTASGGRSGPRVAIVTGGNSGIGLECVTALARRGDEVHMVCRNAERAQEARDRVIQETKNSNVHVHVVDLAEPKDVSAFCSKFKTEKPTLDVLVNNAGCMVNTRTLNSDGLEVNFATNTLAAYLLTSLLLPTLKTSQDPRVITVSSGGMLTQKLDANDLEPREQGSSEFDGTMVYAQNKRQQVVMTEVWAEANLDVFFASMHPGWVDTPAVASSMPSFYEKMKTHLRTPAQGADTLIWLATTPLVKQLKSGDFYFDRAAAPKHLPLAWTHSSPEEKQTFFNKLAKIAQPYLPA